MLEPENGGIARNERGWNVKAAFPEKILPGKKPSYARILVIHENANRVPNIGIVPFDYRQTFP